MVTSDIPAVKNWFPFDLICAVTMGVYYLGKPLVRCKEQPLFKSVTGLNPVFQPILTVTIVPVNMGLNTGFSMVTD